jgi:hypothetical protein
VLNERRLLVLRDGEVGCVRARYTLTVIILRLLFMSALHSLMVNCEFTQRPYDSTPITTAEANLICGEVAAEWREVDSLSFSRGGLGAVNQLLLGLYSELAPDEAVAGVLIISDGGGGCSGRLSAGIQGLCRDQFSRYCGPIIESERNQRLADQLRDELSVMKMELAAAQKTTSRTPVPCGWCRIDVASHTSATCPNAQTVPCNVCKRNGVTDLKLLLHKTRECPHKTARRGGGNNQ